MAIIRTDYGNGLSVKLYESKCVRRFNAVEDQPLLATKLTAKQAKRNAGCWTKTYLSCLFYTLIFNYFMGLQLFRVSNASSRRPPCCDAAPAAFPRKLPPPPRTGLVLPTDVSAFLSFFMRLSLSDLPPIYALCRVFLAILWKVSL